MAFYRFIVHFFLLNNNLLCGSSQRHRSVESAGTRLTGGFVGPQSESSGKAARCFNHWAISYTFNFYLLKKDLLLLILCLCVCEYISGECGCACRGCWVQPSWSKGRSRLPWYGEGAENWSEIDSLDLNCCTVALSLFFKNKNLYLFKVSHIDMHSVHWFCIPLFLWRFTIYIALWHIIFYAIDFQS